MRMHVIQHVGYEGPGLIAQWARERGLELTASEAQTAEYPAVEDVDFLVVMGGPMAADDIDGNPWLRDERRFIAEAIASGKLVLGVCLGSQILASVIGGAVRRNEHREIGWYLVEFTPAGREERLFASWPDTVVVGQWHGDTFDLPVGIDPALSSEACRNQAFVFDGRVVGIQFHLEWTMADITQLISECGSELGEGDMWVMSRSEITDEAPERIEACRRLLWDLLDAMVERGTGIAVG